MHLTELNAQVSHSPKQMSLTSDDLERIETVRIAFENRIELG
jgi:hypothetical protein